MRPLWTAHRLFLATLLLLCMPAVLWATTYHVNKVTGSDSNSCAQAQSASTPKATINAGIGCMASCDTVEVHGNYQDGTTDYNGSGSYPELLVGTVDGSLNVPSSVLTEQPGTKIIPNGSASCYTTIMAASGETPAIVGASGLEYPGGGALFTGFASGQYIKFDGMSFIALSTGESGTASGVYFGEGANYVLRGGLVKYGTIASGHTTSRNVLVEVMEVGPTSPQCQWPAVQPNGQPCPHGLYMCGDDHIIQDNYFHDAGHTCIQVSCEQGGISGITIRRNRLERCRAVGIQIQGSNNNVYSNTIQTYGSVGIRGTALMANNTIYGIDPAFASSDVWGILCGGSSCQSTVNNIVMNQRSPYSFYAINNQNFQPINTGVVHHNMCDASGNVGCTLIQSNDNSVMTDPAGGDFTLPSTSPARGAGVDVAAITGGDRVGNPFASPPEVGAYAFAGGDTTAPSVSMTTPADLAVVAGEQVSVSATASDNVAVVGVQFKLDGVNLQSEDTSSPYTVTWNSRQSAEGNHALTAVARDAGGNTTTATIITVVVQNGPASQPGKKVGTFGGWKVEPQRLGVGMQ